MQRVSVVGNSGARKSTLASRLGAPDVELDAIFHLPGWSPLRVAWGRYSAPLGMRTRGDSLTTTRG